jgi:hypothetical protein
LLEGANSTSVDMSGEIKAGAATAVTAPWQRMIAA